MNKKILIVDDDPSFLSWLRFGLEKKNCFQVVTAETMGQGLNLLDSEKPDLAILDIKLPDGDGFEMCKRIKKGTHPLPVILVTGVFQESDAYQKGNKVGADDLLIKPFSFEQLTLRINRQLVEL